MDSLEWMEMFRRRLCIGVVLFLALLLLQGCVSKEESGKELMQYFNVDIRSEESDVYDEKVREMNRFSVDESAEIAEYIQEELLPASDAHIEKLESLEYETRAIRKLNDMDIKIQQEFYEIFEGIAEDLQNGSSVEEVNEKYAKDDREVQRKIDHYYEKRDKLIDKYDLKSYRDYENADGKQRLKQK